MSKLKLLPLVVFIIAAFLACEKDKYNPGIIHKSVNVSTANGDEKGKTSPEDKTVDELMEAPEEINALRINPEECTPAGQDLKMKLFYRNGSVFHHIGNVSLSHDGNNLNFMIEWRNYAGFQDITSPIDIGFYKTLPAERPSPDGFNYHFNPGDDIKIPIGELVFEDDEASGAECGELLNILFHVDAYFSYNNHPQVSAWVGTPVNLASMDNWYKYFTYLPCCYDEECNDETAWSDGTRYESVGNWATFTPYEGEAKSVTLYAGQTMNAGTVYFTPEGDSVKIKITLNTGWSLQDVAEAVKIQGYTEAPSGNPNPGGFTTYKGNDLEVTVPRFAFYGVHLDLNNCN